MNMKGPCVFLLLLVAETLSYAWSNKINSMLSARSVIPQESDPTLKLLESVATGVGLAMEECRNAFKWERWNCPESAFSRRTQQHVSPETAFTRAILSAGIVHTITKNCSRGELDHCGCDPDKSGNDNIPSFLLTDLVESENNTKIQHGTDWFWGGCSDKTHYAEDISKTFLESLDMGTDPQAHTHLHNYQVGRMIVRKTLTKRCRCHGLTGSCSLQTCWQEIAPFETVVKLLKDRYNHARKLDLGNENSARPISPEMIANAYPNTLLYLENSPDFCKPDNQSGWPGTRGRSCSKDNLDPDQRKSCKRLCRACGYKVKKQRRKISYRCNCTFTWCCRVSCNTCNKTVEEYFCD